MSLKAFHLFFISVSLLCCAFLALWAFTREGTDARASLKLIGALAGAGALFLAAYLVWFARKYRRL